MKSIFIESPITFSGVQLQPHWFSETTGCDEDAILAFTGPSQLILNETESGFLENSDIFFHPNMLHFVANHSHTSYKEAILHQRLFLAAAQQHLPTKFDAKALNLYHNNHQLTITHIQVNGNNALFHVGFFLESDENPLIQGLKDYKIDIKPFAATIMQSYTQEAKLIPKFNPSPEPHNT